MGAEEAVAPVGEASARAEVEATVGQLLQAHGFYAPLELLLMTNRLGYDDYRAWRRGDRETLDQLLPDGVSVTSSFLEEAHTWARGLHLEAASVPMVGTDGCAGVDLKASDDKRLDQLLHTEYRRDVDREQPDMFLDGAQTEAQTDLVDALAARDAATAQARLRRLADLDAAHWAITHARVLIEALQAPGLRHRHEALNRLDVLEHRWLPAASALLRAGARDFLSPLWRDIGRALEGVPFDPDLPNHHPSWAYLNGLDWQNLRRSVHDVASWESEPTLQVRLAQAEWRMRDRRAAMAILVRPVLASPVRLRRMHRIPGVSRRYASAGVESRPGSESGPADHATLVSGLDVDRATRHRQVDQGPWRHQRPRTSLRSPPRASSRA